MNAIPHKAAFRLPSEHETEMADEAIRALAKSPTDRNLTVRLDEDQIVTLPPLAVDLLKRLLTELATGNAVTLVPIHAELTTIQAAALLNVSRPYLIRLIERGEIKAHRVGTHRRVRAEDLLAFKAAQEQRRQIAMEALAAETHELGLDD